MPGMLITRLHCMRAARVLQAYLDGEVEPPTARAVAQHLEECRRCGLAAETYVAIKTAIAACGDGHPQVEPATVQRLTDFARGLADEDGDPR